jgi:hypothetical protein
LQPTRIIVVRAKKYVNTTGRTTVFLTAYLIMTCGSFTSVTNDEPDYS